MLNQILIATRNPGKIATYSIAVNLAGYKSVSPAERPEIIFPEISEDSPSREINSLAKSQGVAKAYGLISLATDEGMSVESYSKEFNKLLAIEPRRLGMGRRLSDEEIVQWHNEKLQKLGGSSKAKYLIAVSVASPSGKSFYEVFEREIILYMREESFPAMRVGYPLDSQSKPVNGKKFLSQLSAEELIATMPLSEMGEFIKKSVDKLI